MPSRRNDNLRLFRTTKDGIRIYTEPGQKSAYDFVVRYRQPGKRMRTPKHIHIIADLYQKRGAKPDLLNDFVDHIISIIDATAPANDYPPTLRAFDEAQLARFASLDDIGEYRVEFLLVVIELIMLQERTNYPNGNMNRRLFQRFRDGADIFSVVGAATFRGS